jgi:hypothetical protein
MFAKRLDIIQSAEKEARLIPNITEDWLNNIKNKKEQVKSK